jgi:hypothetical protein
MVDDFSIITLNFNFRVFDIYIPHFHYKTDKYNNSYNTCDFNYLNYRFILTKALTRLTKLMIKIAAYIIFTITNYQKGSIKLLFRFVDAFINIS